MRKTQELLMLNGKRYLVLETVKALEFKGLVTSKFGTEVTDKDVKKAFSKNKCLLCAKEDYSGSMEGIVVQVEEGSTTGIDVSRSDISEQFMEITKRLGIDIGDEKKNVSVGRETGQEKGYCAYCEDYIDENGKNTDKIVYRSENFFVIPTIGQFAEGYMLIIPYEHVMSNAELSTELLKEFDEMLEDVISVLSMTYKVDSFLVWENGSGHAGRNKAKDSVVHAHVHVIPSKLTANDIEKLSGFEFKEITLQELPEYAENAYLLIRKSKDKWIIISDPELYIPRQYVRQLLGEEYELEGEEWNWKLYPFDDKIEKTIASWKETLKLREGECSERIKNNATWFG